MKLHELKSSFKRQDKKRIGRGPGSGTGKTSGRGQKGQKARSGGGVRPGFEGGQTPLFRRIPKFGFKNINHKEFAPINLDALEANFKDGATVDFAALVKANLVKKSTKLVKVLGRGKITKKLTVKVDAVSDPAKTAIEKAGGKVEVK